MKLRGVSNILLSLYLWGFVLYQLFPIKIIPYVNYAPRKLYPKPVAYTYVFAYDVKTAFSNHTGSIKDLLSAMEREGFDLAFADVPHRIEDKLFPMPGDTKCEVIRVSEISLGEKLLHIIFERIPKILVGEEPERLLSRRSYTISGKCWLLAHDERILLSTLWGFEIPSYNSILSRGKNLFLSREVLFRESYTEDFLKGGIVSFTNGSVKIFAYSEKSFYFPGERTSNPFRLVVETNLSKSLIFLYRNGKRIFVFDQDRINMGVSRPGSYSVEVLSYRFRFNVFYFGLRTLALSSPIELIK